MVKKFKALVLIVMLLLVVGYTPYAAGSLYALELNNDKYNINFVLDDTNTIEYSMEVNSYTEVYAYDFPASVKNPTRKGYDFLGFSETRGGAPLTKVYITTTDKTVYALWKIKTYSIIYVLNNVGATIAGEQDSYTIEDDVTLVSPEANGYTFAGWYKQPSLSEESRVTDFDEESVEHTVLYAKWAYKTYTITYHLDGGQNHENNVTAYNISNSISLQSPIKVGHIFSGWYKDANFTQPISNITAGTYGNMDIYAKWTPREYTVLFKLPDGTNKVVQNVQYGTKVKLPNFNNAFYEIPMFSEDIDCVTGDMVVTVSYINIILVYVGALLLLVVIGFILIMNHLKKQNNIRKIRKKYHDKVNSKLKKYR